MKRMILVLALLTAGSLAGILVQLRASASTPTIPRHGRAAPTVRAAPTTPPSPSLSLSVLEPRVQRAADRAHDQPDDLAADEQPPDGDPPPLTVESIRDRLQAYFGDDPSDPTAGAAATRRIEQRLPATLPTGSSVRSVDCRRSLCRVETLHADGSAYRDFLERAFLHDTRLADGPAFMALLDEPAPGRPLRAVAFIARDGRALPRPDALPPIEP